MPPRSASQPETERDESPPLADFADENEQSLGPGDALAHVMSQFAGRENLRARIHRKRGSAWAFVGTVPADGEMLEVVQSAYGGGSYQGRLVDRNGAWIKGGTFYLDIDGAPRDPNAPRPVAPEQADAPKTMDDVMKFGVLQIFETMAASNRATVKAIESIAQPRAEFSAEKIIAIGGIVVPLITEFIKGGRRDKLTSDDVARIVAEKLEKIGTPKTSIAQVLNEIDAIDSLRDRFGGGNDAGGNDMLMQAIKYLGPMLAKMANAPPAGAPIATIDVPTMEPAGPKLVEDGPLAANPIDGAPAWVAQFAPYAGQLHRIARGGQDPREFAVSLIRFWMPPQSVGQLRELAQHDDAAGQVAQHFPALGEFPGWLDEFFDECRAEFFGEDDEGDAATAAPPPVPKPPRTKKRA